jgi:hydroxymethylbilane synthase
MSAPAFSASRPLRLATRASPLALAQAELVRGALIRYHDLPPENVVLLPIRTSGDHIKDRPLRDFGGKALFVKEVEAALLGGKADMAVHSMKDVPAELPFGLVFGAYLERAPAEDMFIARHGENFAQLPSGARLGTSSLRRQALALKARPDLTVQPLRGSVETRLEKLGRGEVDAIFLAAAGLLRLGLKPPAAQRLDPTLFPPALGQGAIGVEIRDNDTHLKNILTPLTHARTAREVTVERAFLKALGGSCHTPVAGRARESGGRLAFSATLLSPDGRLCESVAGSCENLSLADLDGFGRSQALCLRKQAGTELLRAADLPDAIEEPCAF